MLRFVKKHSLEKVEKVHQENEEELKELLLDKLQTLLKDKSSLVLAKLW
jgi:DNA-directed RNA polymerase subunit beta